MTIVHGVGYRLAADARVMVDSERRLPATVDPGTGNRLLRTVKTKLALSARTYTCTACGLVLDRDVNAARNLAALARQATTAGSGPVAGRGADRKTRPGGPVAVKRQPGTAQAGKAGTVPPQGGTANHTRTRAH